jgi:hypothetical protein
MLMRISIPSVTLVAVLSISTMARAHESTTAAVVMPEQGSAQAVGMPVYVQNIAPDAIEAVKVVDAFSAAVKAVKLDAAEKLLDPNVLILESGGSERSRDEYMGGHAIADAAFLQNAQQQLRYRQAQAEGSFVWVATESTLTKMENGKKSMLLSTETMLLKRTIQGWRIVHIHWSSRPAPNK